MIDSVVFADSELDAGLDVGPNNRTTKQRGFEKGEKMFHRALLVVMIAVRPFFDIAGQVFGFFSLSS